MTLLHYGCCFFVSYSFDVNWSYIFARDMYQVYEITLYIFFYKNYYFTVRMIIDYNRYIGLVVL